MISNGKLLKSLIASLLLLLCLISFAACSGETTPPETTEAETTAAEETLPPETKPTSLIPEGINLRKIVSDYMREMGLVVWKAKEKIDFSKAISITGDIIYKPNTTYRGMPYANMQCGIEPFLLDLDENGVYTGSTDYQKCTGNTCSTSIRNAWQRVSNTVNFDYAIDMLPYYERTGILAIGNIPWDKYDGKNTTNSVLKASTKTDVFEAYAMTDLGDAVTRYLDNNGHARMITGESTVVRNSKGEIDGARSSLVLTEQTSHWVTQTDSKYPTHWSVDRVFTFDSLYKDGYLPVTIAELRDNFCDEPVLNFANKPIAKTFSTTKKFRGKLTTNYRIFSATSKLLDKDGKVLFELFDAPTKNAPRTYDFSSFNNVCDISSLPAGTYTYIASVELGIGDYELVNLSFTIE